MDKISSKVVYTFKGVDYDTEAKAVEAAEAEFWEYMHKSKGLENVGFNAMFKVAQWILINRQKIIEMLDYMPAPISEDIEDEDY